MPTEIFEGRVEDWQEIVKPDFPIYEPLKEWLIFVREQKEGVPIFDTMQPELRITPRFSRKKSHEGFYWSIRCPSGQFTMNMHSRPEQGSDRRYQHLSKEMATWLPRWMQHFSVNATNRITLHYVNALNAATVPDFINAKGELSLNRILAVFSQIPGEHECLVPPFDCKATVRLIGRENANLGIEVSDWPNPQHGVAVRVDLRVDIQTDPRQNVGPTEVLSLIDWAHDRIVDRFEVIFTDQARASFDPVKV